MAEDRLTVALRAVEGSALEYIQSVSDGTSPDAGGAFKDATLQARVNLALVQGIQAKERAHRLATSIEAFGVVMMVPVISDADKWEQTVISAAGKALAIEAVVEGEPKP
jgi:hypothetical protein